MSGDIAFTAQQLQNLTSESEKIAKEICGWMIDKIKETGVYEVEPRNHPLYQKHAQVIGNIDRLRRDLTHQLSQNPTLLVKFCEHVSKNSVDGQIATAKPIGILIENSLTGRPYVRFSFGELKSFLNALPLGSEPSVDFSITDRT